MELSVVLISWNSERYVADCLDALVTACEGLERELIWVDNGSTDRTRAILEPYLSRENILLIPLTQNLGVARARNLGIQRSTGKMVLLLDVDTRITREALRAMIDFLAYHPDCGLCGCKLYDERGEVQMSCRHYPSLRYKIYNVLERFTDAAWVRELNRSQFYAERMAGDTPFAVEYIIGACQLIRRELIERIGLLDGRIFYWAGGRRFLPAGEQGGVEGLLLAERLVLARVSEDDRQAPSLAHELDSCEVISLFFL